MQTTITTEADVQLDGHCVPSRDVPLYKQLSGWRLAKCLLRRMVWRLSNIWCIWSGTVHSFLGHIRLQSPKETPRVDFGSALMLGPDGLLVPRPSTCARIDSIGKLEAKYPWIDFVDRRIFLEGFDAGEQLGHSIQGTEIER
jgi:hypothetical protein